MPASVRSLGILGGTFNPPHRGHVALALDALGELRLDEVLLMPAHTPPHKRHDARDAPGGAREPDPLQRLRMCELAIAGIDGLAVSALEIERGGPSYTVDTLRSIHASNPQAELTFVVGADTAGTLPSWREPRELLSLTRLAVAGRAGAGRRRALEAIEEVAGEPADVRFLEMPRIDVSSSMVRARVARGEPVADLVGAEVAGYIAEHGLYGAEQAQARR